MFVGFCEFVGVNDIVVLVYWCVGVSVNIGW